MKVNIKGECPNDEKNEKIEEALKRETWEELGISDFESQPIGRYIWESERESFRSDRPPYHTGRSTVVAPAHTHGTADDIGLAVMGARGLHDLGQIIEDDEESEEEKREREARNAGSALGAVVGIAAGLAIGMDDDDEDIDDGEYEDEDEVEGFGISM